MILVIGISSKFIYIVVLVLKEEVNECKDEKIVKATKKGAAVLDPWLPEHIKISYHVFQKASLICSCNSSL